RGPGAAPPARGQRPVVRFHGLGRAKAGTRGNPEARRGSAAHFRRHPGQRVPAAGRGAHGGPAPAPRGAAPGRRAGGTGPASPPSRAPVNAAPLLQPAPRLVVGAALLLWGWQNGFLPYAAIMAVMIEGAQRAAWRWRVSAAEFNLVADASSLVLLAVVIYVFSTRGAQGIFVILALLPFMFFPLLTVQVYSERGSTPLPALFISLRRHGGLLLRRGDAIDLT